MIHEIEQECRRRNITRICHFTPSRNLIHILSREVGILATKHLQDNERNLFTATDLKRYDQHTDHICCSVQYPNAWYFDKARSEDSLFRDWVVLLISPKYLWHKGTRFCPRNAASNKGGNISEGFSAFLAMFAQKVEGAYKKIQVRESDHLLACPTDDQAEVLVPDQIALSDILAIAVSSEEQAKNEIVRLKYADPLNDKFQFIIAPDFFNKYEISRKIRLGVPITETPYSRIGE